MAFTEKEIEIIRFGLQNGKSKDEVKTALIKYRTGVSPTPTKTDTGYSFGETGTDVAETIGGVGKQFGKAGEEIVSTITDEKQSVLDKALSVGAKAFRGGARAFGELVTGAAKVAVPQEVEEQVTAGVQELGEKVAEQPLVRDLIQRYNTLDPETKRNVDNALGYAEGLAEIFTGGVASKITKSVIQATKEAATDIGTRVGTASSEVLNASRTKAGTLFNKPVKSVDDAVLQAEESAAKTRTITEAGAPELSFQEKWVGISPDIKKRIAGKQDKMVEYFDVAHARNVDDTAPTPYEFGASRAQDAVSEMETLLNESGGKIGATREKIGTYKASQDQVLRVENSFVQQIDKLNLEVRNGVVRQKAGKITKAGTGDIKVLNDLYQDIKVIKQSPTLTNLIEYRSALDSRVNFAKRAAEASNEIDPFARSLRKDIADVGAEIVGKTEAAELKRFSDFMDAYQDLRSYTDRKAGGEYLLKLVLSGRGGEARQIIQTIKEYTGIDLMDDATMMTIATDVVGNSRQQNQFRQEITKAGLDVAALVKGSPTGAAGLLSNLITKQLLDQEKIYTKAAQ